MNRIARIAVAATLLAVVFVGCAWAVGYERYTVINGRVADAPPVERNAPRGLRALTELDVIEKAPHYLDQAAFAVRDLLGQFGIGSGSGVHRP